MMCVHLLGGMQVRGSDNVGFRQFLGGMDEGMMQYSIADHQGSDVQ